MSYILDALQRAEAERERANVPGLNARPVPPSAAPTALSTRQRAALSAVAVALLGTAAAGMWAWRARVDIPVAEPAAQAKPATALVPVVPLDATTVAAPPVARVVAPKPAPTSPPPSEKLAAPGSSAAASLPLLTELPDDIRRQIPALTINGAVYSDNPAQRLLLVNGQVLSQGSLAAPDLTLERIGANTSEFSFRGTRFRIAH
jgi:general secretion pathway protein B